jgi:hypothetical protein
MKVKRLLTTGLVTLMGLLSGCGDEAMSKDINEATKFDWYAVATAPRDYPMEVISGTFYYKGEDHGLDIPSGGTLNVGWGESASAYIVGPKFKPLPDRLEVTFYSYAENQFYHGNFDLPYEKIFHLFQTRLNGAPESPYDAILVGIAPGGVVAVWLESPVKSEVFFGHAEKVDMPPNAAFGLPFQSKEQAEKYVEDALKESVTAEQFTYIKKYGAPIGLWDRFRKLYKWTPTYKDGKIPHDKELIARFINGERYEIPIHFTEDYANTPKPLLKVTNFRAGGPQGPIYDIDFDEIELIEVFEKLGSNGEMVYLEFDPQLPELKMKIRAYNDKESIEFKKVKVE